MFPRHLDEAERLSVWLAGKEPVDEAMKHGAGGRHRGEQGGAGSQLHVVWKAEDVRGGKAFDADCGGGALSQTRPEQWMREKRLRFGQALHRVLLRGWADPETVELREDVPHPVRHLPAASDLGQGCFVVMLLSAHEALQIVRIDHRSRLLRYPIDP